tara:strand:+ start:32133 stop:34931 length:2799 start_codon:yes stop_codon:yes gene_type:complete
VDKIQAKGIRENNLKNIDLEIPRGKISVFTGVSGSGKSTLAFDTIFVEGQRRYLESLSSYAKQFVEKFKKPDLDHISGLSPSVSVDQKTFMRNPRSTVATITEIYDFIRLAYSRLGTPYCYECGSDISTVSVESVLNKLKEINLHNEVVDIYYPIAIGKKGEFKKELNLASKLFSIARIDGKTRNLSENISLEKQKNHNIDIYVDSISNYKKKADRLMASIETAFSYGDGVCILEVKNERLMFNQNLGCKNCNVSYPEISPRLFSFNSPYGACNECEGLGYFENFDFNLLIDDMKSIDENAILPFKDFPQLKKTLKNFCLENKIDTKKPFKKLTSNQKKILINGTNFKSMKNFLIDYESGKKNFEGILKILEKWDKGARSEEVRDSLGKYKTLNSCHECKGSRIRIEALNILINKKNIHDFCSLNIKEAMLFIEDVAFDGLDKTIWEKISAEVLTRLEFLDNVGLSYLTLNRSAPTLSGGEAQRIRLASQLGANLTGVTYVLDEPTIGLHPRDNSKLIDSLKLLKNRGNTVLVVEHDDDTIRSADNIVDVGPLAGINGGNIVFSGSLSKIKKAKNSLTMQYLLGKKEICKDLKEVNSSTKFLTVSGIKKNNLKNLDIKLPLSHITCVTGVSGSGKSSLVTETLAPGIDAIVRNSKKSKFLLEKFSDCQHLDKVINIDQSPIGRTSRSNPVTYSGIFSTIREIFSSLQISKMKGYGPGRFSFNVKDGSCPTCSGAGNIKIEMSFLPDVVVVCDECQGKRFDLETLSISYKGKTIADVLDMSFEEADSFFSGFPILKAKIEVINSIGLGYLKLGQSATTLSGGEAQRIKLSKELLKKNTEKTLYILDEPTIGLHYHDVNNLMNVLYKLRNSGSSILIVEHNLDVISRADYIIDLGPEGGENGGFLQYMGSIKKFASSKSGETSNYLQQYMKKFS